MTARRLDRSGRAIQIVWIAGFVIGTLSHVLDLISGGFDTYAAFPLPLRLFWVSLTFLDPLTATLIALGRRSGVVLGLVIILTDIAVNWFVYLTIGGNPLFGVVNQSVFAVILVATAVPLWRWMPRRRGLSRSSVS